MSNSDPQNPNVEGTPNENSDRYKGAPSSDYFASVHTVEVDEGGHREKRSLNFYRPDSNQRVRPGDDLETAAQVMIPREKLERLGADPDEAFSAGILPDANVDAPAGSIGMFEKLDAGRVRFLGTVEELGGERVPLDD